VPMVKNGKECGVLPQLRKRKLNACRNEKRPRERKSFSARGGYRVRLKKAMQEEGNGSYPSEGKHGQSEKGKEKQKDRRACVAGKLPTK